MYKTEKEFYDKGIKQRLSKYFKCVRLESRATHTGIPDVLIMGSDLTTFIELKVLPKQSIHDKHITVPWRPGQLAFASTYFISNMCKKLLEGVLCVKMTFSWTAIAMKDGVILIKHSAHGEISSAVEDIKDAYVFKFTWDEWHKLHLAYFIRVNSHEYILGDMFSYNKYASICIADNLAFAYSSLDVPTDDEFDTDSMVDSSKNRRMVADVLYTLLINKVGD